jgi:chorismate mutase-like protein
MSFYSLQQKSATYVKWETSESLVHLFETLSHVSKSPNPQFCRKLSIMGKWSLFILTGLLTFLIVIPGLSAQQDGSVTFNFENAPAASRRMPIAEIKALARLVDQRLSYMKDVAAYKWVNDLAIEDLEREQVVLENSMQGAREFDLDPASTRQFFEQQIHLAKVIQQYWFDRWEQEGFQPCDFADLSTKIRPALLRLGHDILLAVGELAPWQYPEGRLDKAAPVFINELSVKEISKQEKEKLYHAALEIKSTDADPALIKVGYPPVSTSLPLFVALEEGLFKEKGIRIEPVQYATANQIVAALAAGEIQATSVCADYPWLSLAAREEAVFKIYAWEMLDTLIPFDLILSRKGSAIHRLADLEGKAIGTFPGSQLRHYLELILENTLGRLPAVNIIELAPADQIPALASGKIDALFTLEPMALIALLEGVGQVVETSPISKYIGGGQPMPAASFALSAAFIEAHPKSSRKFVQAMDKAIRMINKDQQRYRYLYPRFTTISTELAAQIPVTNYSTFKDMDLMLFQKEADILFEAGLLSRRLSVSNLVYTY